MVEQRTHHGKWSEPGVPHRGWYCIGIEDLGAPNHICEMCECQSVRYVHAMENDDYSGVLNVGCICAGRMQEDLVAARDREKRAKKRTGRRARWLTRQWRTSGGGNDYLNVDGFNIVVYPAGTKWGFRIACRNGGGSWLSQRRYATEDQAKLAAFDAMMSRIDKDDVSGKCRSKPLRSTAARISLPLPDDWGG